MSLQLLILAATLFVAMAGFSVVIPALGDLALRFGATSFEMGAMTAAYAMAQLMFAPAWGSLCDRVGRKPVLVVGLVGFGLSFLLMGLATGFWGLLAGRVLGGILSASTLPSAQAFAADLVAPHERSAAMGRLGAAMALGFVFGPLLSTALLPLGVRAPFLFSLVLALVTAAASALLLSESDPSVETHRGFTPSLGIRSLMEYALASPATVWFWSAFVIMFGASSVFALLVFFVEEELHGTAMHASIVFACYGASSALCQGLLLRPLVLRLGEVGAVRAGLAIGVGGFAAFAVAPNVPVLCAATALIAAGMAIGRPISAALASRETSFGQGVTMGLQSAFDALGRVLGPLSAGLVYTWSPRAPFACAALAYALGLIYVGRSTRESGERARRPGT